jgi:hypothetical protein
MLTLATAGRWPSRLRQLPYMRSSQLALNQETAGSNPARVALGPIVHWLGFGPFKAAKTGRNRLGLPTNPACSWRTLDGLAEFALVQSYLSTARKWGICRSTPSAACSTAAHGSRPASNPPDNAAVSTV